MVAGTSISTALERIAAEVGVSTRTVYRVLNNDIPAERPTVRRRAERIRAVAQRLGYMPNSAAKATATGRFAAVGLLSSTAARYSYLPAGLLGGIQDALAERDWHLVVGRLPDERLSTDDAVPRVLREWSVDGLLINYTHRIPGPLHRLIEEHRVPSIWLNASRNYDAIHPDDLQAGELATQHLLQLGHRRIAYFKRGQSDHYSVADRAEGYCRAMRSAGLSPQTVLRVESEPVVDASSATAKDELSAYLQHWFKGDDRPSAVVTYGIGDAEAVLFAAASAGLSVPRDLSVVAIGDRVHSVGIALTTACVNEAVMGRRAIDMLIEKIDRPADRLAVQSQKYELCRGQTSGPHVE